MSTQKYNAIFDIGSYTYADYPDWIKAVALTKKACFNSAAELGLIEPNKAQVLTVACDSLLRHPYKEKFAVCLYGGSKDVFMRAFNQALFEVASSDVPTLTSEDLTIYRSINAVVSTSTEVVRIFELKKILEAAQRFAHVLETKAEEFKDVQKLGRIGLSDYLPVTVGWEFAGYACGVRRLINKIQHELNIPILSTLGHDEIGSPKDFKQNFGQHANNHLSKMTGQQVENANAADALIAGDNLITAHAVIQALSNQIWRVARDIRLMCSGPRGGLQEITVPAVAPGSSIMPGKLNPVIAEMVFTTIDQVDANHAGLVMALKSGWLEGGNSSFIPIRSLIKSADLLARTMDCFSELCIKEITVNPEHCKHLVEQSLALITLVKNMINEETAKKIVLYAKENRCSVPQACLALKAIPKNQLNAIFGNIGLEVFEEEIKTSK